MCVSGRPGRGRRERLGAVMEDGGRAAEVKSLLAAGVNINQYITQEAGREFYSICCLRSHSFHVPLAFAQWTFFPKL